MKEYISNCCQEMPYRNIVEEFNLVDDGIQNIGICIQCGKVTTFIEYEE